VREIDHDHMPWHLEPTRPGMEERFRKWNILITIALAFLVLGILIAAAGMAEKSLEAHRTKQISQLVLANVTSDAEIGKVKYRKAPFPVTRVNQDLTRSVTLFVDLHSVHNLR
jgi:hypothetical protein